MAALGCTTAAGGCATQHACCTPAEPQPIAEIQPVEEEEFDRAVAASALLFGPRMYANELGPELSREGRERSAFVGYEERTTTFSYIRIDDRQTGDNRERYERRAVIESVGTSTR